MNQQITVIRCPVVFLFLLLSASAAYSQQKCSMKLSDAPAVRGFRLGMAGEEVQKLLSSTDKNFSRPLKANRDQFGFSFVSFSPGMMGLSGDFSGIFRVNLEFLDERLSKFSFQYPNEGRLSIEEFTAKISEATGLPKDWAGKRPSEVELILNYRRELNCDGFRVEAEAFTVSMELTFIDEIAASLLIERKAAKRRQDRETFRP
jgi:hypothetical protein